MNKSMTIWNWHGEIRTRPGPFVMLDDEAFPWTPNHRLREAGRWDSKWTTVRLTVVFRTFGHENYGTKCFLGIKMGISADSSWLRDASAITPTMIRPNPWQGRWPQRNNGRSTVRQGETRQVSERQHASDVVVAVEAARSTRSSAMLCVKYVDAVALEEMAEERKSGWPWQTRKMRGWPCCARVEPAIVPKP